ncbi:hypothetical protein D3C76_1352880 [compost metagenome]
MRAAATGDQPQTGFWQGEHGIGSGETDVTRQHQFQPATHAVAMNGGDHRFGDAVQGFDPAYVFHALANLQAGLWAAAFLDIGARTKAPFAFPANHDHANVRILLQQRQCLRYALADLVVDGVDLSGTGQYHPAHHGIALQAHSLVDQHGELRILRCAHAGHSSNSKT